MDYELVKLVIFSHNS